MPDAKGNFRGQGWSRARERAWDRIFGTTMRYCNNTIETPSDQRCWPGKEGVPRQVLTESATSSASTTKVGNSSPRSRERRGES